MTAPATDQPEKKTKAKPKAPVEVPAFHGVVPRSALLGAVAGAAEVTPSKTTEPSLKNILVESLGGKMRFTGTDAEQFSQVTIPVEGAPEGAPAFCLDGRVFGGILAKLTTDSPVSMRFEENMLNVQAAPFAFSLATQPSAEFVQLDAAKGPSFKVSGEQFSRMVKQTAYAASTEEARAHFTGVLWEFQEGAMSMVATNTHRLSYREEPVENLPDWLVGKRILIPATAMELLARHAGLQEVEVTLGETLVTLSTANAATTVKQLDANAYPQYRFIMDEARQPHAVLVDRADLIAAKGAVDVVAEQDQHQLVRLGFTEANVKVSAAAKVGNIMGDVPVKGAVNPASLEWPYQSAYLGQALAAMDGTQVTLHFPEAPTHPLRVVPSGLPDNVKQVSIVLPVNTGGTAQAQADTVKAEAEAKQQRQVAPEPAAG